MRGNKFEKSHIHILESETLRRLSRVTESAQEIVDSIPCNCEWYSYINSCQLLYTFGGVILQQYGDFTWRVSDCEELVGVNSKGMMGLILGGSKINHQLVDFSIMGDLNRKVVIK